MAALERAFREERDKVDFDFDAASTWSNEDAKATLAPIGACLWTVAVHVEPSTSMKAAAFRATGFDSVRSLQKRALLRDASRGAHGSDQAFYTGIMRYYYSQ